MLILARNTWMSFYYQYQNLQFTCKIWSFHRFLSHRWNITCTMFGVGRKMGLWEKDEKRKKEKRQRKGVNRWSFTPKCASLYTCVVCFSSNNNEAPYDVSLSRFHIFEELHTLDLYILCCTFIISPSILIIAESHSPRFNELVPLIPLNHIFNLAKW